MTAVDISEQGLQRLAGFAETEKLHVATCCIDLDDQAALQQLGAFDNIVMSYFKPAPELLVRLAGLLNPGR